MNDDQFEYYVAEATREVYAKGLEASPQAITVYCFGQLDKRQQSRVIRLDGKAMGSFLLALGGGVGAIAAKILESI